MLSESSPVTSQEIGSQDFQYLIEKTLDGNGLNFEESKLLMRFIMSGELNQIQTSGILTALRSRLETAEEIAGFSSIMLDKARRIQYNGVLPLIDIVGTGGSRFKTFNVSSTSAIILSSLDIAVAKHGNRSSTSKSGSADFFEELGVNIHVDPKKSEEILNKTGFAFMFAPLYHPAMKFVIPVRKQLKIRTIFNLLGPLTNPAQVKSQVTGLFSRKLLMPVGESLKKRGYENVVLVSNEIGADEFIPKGINHVVELRNNELFETKLQAKDFGLPGIELKVVQNRSSVESAELAVRLFLGENHPILPFILMNSAVGLKVAGKVDSYPEGVDMVQEQLFSGNVIDKLLEIVKTTEGNSEKLKTLIERFE